MKPLSARWAKFQQLATLAVLMPLLAGCGQSHAEDAAKIGPLSQAGGNPPPAADANPGGDHPFPRRTPAPALEGGTEWLNTTAPVELKDLRGKFVILDFWTYCCINCMHVLPELKKLEKAYPNNVVVIGVHSGKFDTEHDAQSIRQAIMRYEIEHPVVNDADLKIWNSYGVTSWPSLFVIDPQGNAVKLYRGETSFDTLDQLLKNSLPYYHDKGLLNEQPIHFKLEREKAAQTPLRYPGKILADEKTGRLFIADSNHNRVVVTSLEGDSQTLSWGRGQGEGTPSAKVLAIIGAGTVGKADGDFKTAQFNHPQGMALLGDTLYIADTENHLLRKADLKTQRVVTIAGTGEQAHSPWPGVDFDSPHPQLPDRFVGPPLKTAISSPWALCILGRDLYIAMAGTHQIWKMPLDESEIGPFAGNGREDIVDGPLLPREPYDPDFASFAQPSGLSTDGNTLFVADSEGSSVRAVLIRPAGNVSTVVGTSRLDEGRLFTFGDIDGPPGKARFQHCLDVAFHDGRIYVADTYNDKIKAIDLKTRETKTVAGTGKPGHADLPSPSATVHSNLPSPSGRGAGGEGAAEFFEPAGLSFAAGKLYVADTNNHLIRVIDVATGRVSTLQITGL